MQVSVSRSEHSASFLSCRIHNASTSVQCRCRNEISLRIDFGLVSRSQMQSSLGLLAYCSRHPYSCAPNWSRTMCLRTELTVYLHIRN